MGFEFKESAINKIEIFESLMADFWGLVLEKQILF